MLEDSQDKMSSKIQESLSALMGRTLEFCRLLMTAELTVTPGRVIDVFRALPKLDWLSIEEVRVGMRTNLVSSHEEEQIFNRLFDAFWLADSPSEVETTELELEPRPEDENPEIPEAPPDVLGSPAQYSVDEVPRDVDLGARWPLGEPPIHELIRELAMRLATRPSRRFRPDPNGRRVDMRSSLRRNVRYGMDVINLAKKRRRVRKTRIVMLCDVSGSMDTYNPFLLQLMFGLQKELKNSRTVVFSTQTTEVTTILRRQTVGRTLFEIARKAKHWSGGTDIGSALSDLNRHVLREGAASSTVAILISDGYDQGEVGVVDHEMRALRRRVRKVVWINPLLGTEGYAPIAKGMRAALPYVNHFMPAHDIPSLKALCRDLARV